VIRTLAGDLAQSLRPPICAAGFPRSGTTWLGAALNYAPGVRTYHEPFNPVTVPDAGPFDHRYAVAARPDPEFDEFCRKAFAGRVEGPHVAASLSRRFRSRLPWPGRTLVKTVFGTLGLERIQEITGARVVLIVRDPRDVAASWHRLGWQTETHLRSLLDQPALMEDHLGPYEGVLRDADDFFSRIGALWGAVHLVVGRLAERNPEWTLLSFEELCADPVARFRRLYADLGLRWTARAERRVRSSSDTASKKPFRPARVSRAQTGKWKNELEAGDVARLETVLGRFPVHLPGWNGPALTPQDPAPAAAG
jgi:hypothetical protein